MKDKKSRLYIRGIKIYEKKRRDTLSNGHALVRTQRKKEKGARILAITVLKWVNNCVLHTQVNTFNGFIGCAWHK